MSSSSNPSQTDGYYVPVYQEPEIESPVCGPTRFTGDGRMPVRERIHRMRGQTSAPGLAQQDTTSAAAGHRAVSEAPKTPTRPDSALECPGAPRAKGTVSQLRRMSAIPLDFRENVLVDREVNERCAERGPLFLDVSGSAVQGKRSPLRNSWEPETASDIASSLYQLLEKADLRGDDDDEVEKPSN